MSERHGSYVIGCQDCGLVQALPRQAAARVCECRRCGNALRPAAGVDPDVTLVFSISAFLLLVPATLSPLLSLTSFGTQRTNTLPSGVEALWRDGFLSLAGIVFLFSVAIPFVYLGLTIWVLGSIRLGSTAALGRLFRWAGRLRPWMMVEVYLVGCCVAYSRLQSIGSIRVGVGGWCLMGATLTVMLAALSLDEQRVWSSLPPPVPLQRPPASRATVSCDDCDLVLAAEFENGTCPRCRAHLHRRKPAALPRTLALVVAGSLLYVPANLLPVLSIERFGRDDPNTILGGVHELIINGLWPLAAVVFAASILVPLMKLLGLSMILLLTHRHSRRWLLGRTRLYRVIDLIGRWSSIDLFMISILVALVRFGTLTNVRAQAGAVAFAAVVVTTMFASRCFDPRLMWDHRERDGRV